MPQRFDPAKARAARKRAGQRREDTASLVGCAFHSIGRYERGEHVPNAEVLLALAAAFGVEPAELFSDDSEQVPA